MLHCSWDTMHDRCNSYFLFWAIFYPFTNDPKNQNFKKMKKIPGDIIILYMSTKNNDYMMYGSWNMVHNRWTDRKSDIWRWMPYLKRSNFFRGFTPTRALPWTHWGAYNTSRPPPAFYNIWKFNLCSKTVISKTAWINAWYF